MIEKLYTVEEVAELASVTGRTIRNYLKSGRLVGRKIGGQWRFPESEVQRLLTGGEPEPEELPLEEEEIAVKQEQTITPPVKQAQQPSAIAAQEYAYDSYEDFTPPQQEAPSTQPYYEKPVMEEYYTAAPAAPMQQEAPRYQYAPNYPTGNPAPVPVPKPVPPPYSPQPSAPSQNQAPRVSTFGQPSLTPEGNHPPYPQHTPMPAAYSEEFPPAPINQTPAGFSPQTNYPAAPAMHPNYNEPPMQHAIAGQNYAPPVYPTVQQPYPQNTPPSSYQPAPSAVPQTTAPEEKPPVNNQEEKSSVKPARNTKQGTEEKTPIAPELSDVGKQVMRFVAEVHDCSLGPQVCTIVDLHHSLSAAKATSERLAEIARQESEHGQLCQSFVEFDERYFVARYTLFGTSSFLARCLKLLG